MSRYEILADGEFAAEVDAPDVEDALREALHYAAMYGQDGGNITIRACDDESFQRLRAMFDRVAR